jgi:hypothetical protein
MAMEMGRIPVGHRLLIIWDGFGHVMALAVEQLEGALFHISRAVDRSMELDLLRVFHKAGQHLKKERCVTLVPRVL